MFRRLSKHLLVLLAKLGAVVQYRFIDVIPGMRGVNNNRPPLRRPKAMYSVLNAIRRAGAGFTALPLHQTGHLLRAMRADAFDSSVPRRAGNGAQHLGEFKRVNMALLAAIWAGQMICQPRQVALPFPSIEKLNHPTSGRVAEDPAIIEGLQKASEDAVSRGVFGVPTFLVDGETFLRVDCLHFIRRRLDLELGTQLERAPRPWRENVG